MSFGQHPTVLSPPSSPTPFFNQILPPLTTRRPRIRLIHNKPLPSDTDDWIDGTMEHGSDGPGHSHSHGNLYRSHPSVPRVPIIQVGRRYPAGSQLAAMFPGDPVRPGEKARSQAEIDEERKQQEKYKPKDPDNLRDEYGRKLSPFRIMTDDGPIRPPPSPKKQKMADDEMDGETKMPDNKPAKPADHARSPLSHAALQLYWFIFRFGGLKDRGITTMMLLNFLNEFFSYELDHADIAEMDELVGRYTPNLYDAEDDFYKTDPGELYAVESIYSADKKMRDIFCNLDETEAGQLFALQESIYFADTKMRDKFQNFIYQLEGLVGMEHVDLYFCGPRENIELLKSTPALYKEAQYRKRYNWTVIIGWFKVNLRPEKFIVPDGDAYEDEMKHVEAGKERQKEEDRKHQEFLRDLRWEEFVLETKEQDQIIQKYKEYKEEIDESRRLARVRVRHKELLARRDRVPFKYPNEPAPEGYEVEVPADHKYPVDVELDKDYAWGKDTWYPDMNDLKRAAHAREARAARDAALRSALQPDFPPSDRIISPKRTASTAWPPEEKEAEWYGEYGAAANDDEEQWQIQQALEESILSASDPKYGRNAMQQTADDETFAAGQTSFQSSGYTHVPGSLVRTSVEQLSLETEHSMNWDPTPPGQVMNEMGMPTLTRTDSRHYEGKRSIGPGISYTMNPAWSSVEAEIQLALELSMLDNAPPVDSGKPAESIEHVEYTSKYRRIAPNPEIANMQPAQKASEEMQLPSATGVGSRPENDRRRRGESFDSSDSDLSYHSSENSELQRAIQMSMLDNAPPADSNEATASVGQTVGASADPGDTSQLENAITQTLDHVERGLGSLIASLPPVEATAKIQQAKLPLKPSSESRRRDDAYSGESFDTFATNSSGLSNEADLLLALEMAADAQPSTSDGSEIIHSTSEQMGDTMIDGQSDKLPPAGRTVTQVHGIYEYSDDDAETTLKPSVNASHISSSSASVEGDAPTFDYEASKESASFYANSVNRVNELKKLTSCHEGMGTVDMISIPDPDAKTWIPDTFHPIVVTVQEVNPTSPGNRPDGGPSESSSSVRSSSDTVRGESVPGDRMRSISTLRTSPESVVEDKKDDKKGGGEKLPVPGHGAA